MRGRVHCWNWLVPERYWTGYCFWFHIRISISPSRLDRCRRWSACFIPQLIQSLTFTVHLAILALRTWAVWKRDLRVGLILLALEITYTVVSIIYSLSFVNSLHGMCFDLEVYDIIYTLFSHRSAVWRFQRLFGSSIWKTWHTLGIISCSYYCRNWWVLLHEFDYDVDAKAAVLILMAASAFRACGPRLVEL